MKNQHPHYQLQSGILIEHKKVNTGIFFGKDDSQRIVLSTTGRINITGHELVIISTLIPPLPPRSVPSSWSDHPS
jgi:hypothetical protein